MRPVSWSISYLLRCPLGISMVTSNSTSLVSRDEAAQVHRRSLTAMRGRIAALSAVIAVVAGGGAAYVATRPDLSRNGSPVATTTPSSSPTASPAAVLWALWALAPAGVVPTRAGVSAVMRRAVRDPSFGGALAALVVDA